GMTVSAMSPARVTTMEMTIARRGRRMKTSKIMAASLLAGQRRICLLEVLRIDHGLVRIHDNARTHLLLAADDHPLVCREPFEHNDIGADLLPKLDTAHLDLVVLCDDKNRGALLIEIDSRLRNHQPRIRLLGDDSHTDELLI